MTLGRRGYSNVRRPGGADQVVKPSVPGSNGRAASHVGPVLGPPLIALGYVRRGNELRTCLPTTIDFQDWEGAQDFQTRLHLSARARDLFVSVMIRGFRRVALAYASGSARIGAHGSVRVEFESTRGVHTAHIPRTTQDPATRVQIPNGFRPL